MNNVEKFLVLFHRYKIVKLSLNKQTVKYVSKALPVDLESTQLGIFITGRNEVGPRIYFHKRLSVHRGEGCLPQCMLGYTPQWEQTHTPLKQTPRGADTPPGSRPPWKQTPAYGQRAAGTHPTGMHSCFKTNSVRP